MWVSRMLKLLPQIASYGLVLRPLYTIQDSGFFNKELGATLESLRSQNEYMSENDFKQYSLIIKYNQKEVAICKEYYFSDFTH